MMVTSSNVCRKQQEIRQQSSFRQDQQGLSILEALVAIALIATAFLPLLVLQGQLTRTTIAVERAEANMRVQANALAYLRTLNPSQRPSGSESLGDGVTMTWQAQAVAPARPARAMSGEIGRFEMQLYDLDVELQFSDGRANSFIIRQVGWVATRPVASF